MKPKNYFKAIAILIIGLLFTGTALFAQREIKGNGNVVKEERNIQSFTEVSISSAFEVYLTQGNREELIVEIDENLLEGVKTEVVGGRLKIYTSNSIRKAEEMNIYLTFKDLEQIKVSGAVEINGQNSFDLDEFELECSGASEIDLDLSANKLELDLSGASEIYLKGKVKEFMIDCSGASELDASGLEADYLKLDASGASEIKVFVNEELDIEASGASTVRYKGNPRINMDNSGASSVKRY